MHRTRLLFLAALAAASAIPTAASAQIFWKSPDFTGAPLNGLEPGFGVAMPGANAKEQTAGLVWNLRSALNLAALQCQFEPTLRTVENYNQLLGDHREELGEAYKTITAYFKRTTKTVAASQKALDTYGTRTISYYSTVRGQLGFCEVAGRVGRKAIGAPRGTLKVIATENLRTIKNSLAHKGEQQFYRQTVAAHLTLSPQMTPSCWDKRNKYKATCGYFTMSG